MSTTKRTPPLTRSGTPVNLSVVQNANASVVAQVAELNKICVQTNSMISELQLAVQKLLAENNRLTKTVSKLELSISNIPAGTNNMTMDVIKKTISEAVADSNKPAKPSFAGIVKSNSVVVVKPKKQDQSSLVTKKHLRENIDPIDLPIADIRNTANGGLIIECVDSDASDKLFKNVSDKLSEDYNVNISKKRLPKIKVIGLSEELAFTEIERNLVTQNPDVFTNKSNIKVLHCFKLKKGSSLFGIRVEVDGESFVKLMNNSPKLRIGWDVCSVYECFDLVRCFKCCGFHHMADKCTAEVICFKCSGNHKRAVCTSTIECCTNCKSAASTLNMEIDTSHSAFSNDCSVYKRKIDMERKRINYNNE